MDFKDFQAGVPHDHFWVQAKRDFVKQTLEQQNISKAAKILDVGAGVGDDIKMLASFGSLYVVDIDPQVLAHVPHEFITEVRVADICILPYPDSFFDVIVCFDVLEHVSDDRRAVIELQRVLKPGGKLFFTVPAYQCLFGQHDVTLGHYRRYTKQRVNNLFAALQLEQQALSHWFSVLFVPAALSRFMHKNNDKAGMKPLGRILNKLLYAIVSCENFLIRCGVRFPLGLSVWGVYRKQAQAGQHEETSCVRVVQRDGKEVSL